MKQTKMLLLSWFLIITTICITHPFLINVGRVRGRKKTSSIMRYLRRLQKMCKKSNKIKTIEQSFSSKDGSTKSTNRNFFEC